MVGPFKEFKLRRGLSTTWTEKDPILSTGEPGFETDTGLFKIGDGISAWTALTYHLNALSTAQMIQEMIDDAVLDGVPGPKGDPGIQGIQGIQGIPGTNGTNGTNGSNGEDGIDGSDGEDGAQGPPGESGDLYPLSALGFVAASVRPEVAKASSTSGPWVVRVWVPSGVSFSKVGVYITATGAVGNTLNAFALYDDAGTLISQTPNNNNLWTTAGWKMQDFPSPIASQGTGRFVRIAFAMNGSDPSILYCQHEDILVLNGIATNRRSYFGPSRNAGFPSTINPASEGSEFPYVPLVVLA